MRLLAFEVAYGRTAVARVITIRGDWLNRRELKIQASIFHEPCHPIGLQFLLQAEIEDLNLQ